MFYLSSILVIVIVCDATRTDNFTRRYDESVLKTVFNRDQRRLISFSDEGEVELGLEFSVPFLILPVRNTMEHVRSSLVTLNVASIVMTGVIIFGAVFILPLLLTLIDKKSLIPNRSPIHFWQGGQRARSDEPDLWTYLSLLDKIFLQYDIDVNSCSRKLVCEMVRHSSDSVSRGSGSSMDKVLDGLASNEWLQENLMNAALAESVKLGLKGGSCSNSYYRCGISSDQMYLFIRNVMARFNI